MESALYNTDDDQVTGSVRRLSANTDRLFLHDTNDSHT
jgi:hypothetical protein